MAILPELWDTKKLCVVWKQLCFNRWVKRKDSIRWAWMKSKLLGSDQWFGAIRKI